MKMDEETLIHLEGGHIPMPERLSKGIWPYPPLPFEALVPMIRVRLDIDGWFPRRWQTPKPGEAIDETGTIEKRDSHYIYRAVRSNPLNPTEVADEVETVFESAEAAIRHYLKWDLHLPGDLDGWKVVA